MRVQNILIVSSGVKAERDLCAVWCLFCFETGSRSVA